MKNILFALLIPLVCACTIISPIDPYGEQVRTVCEEVTHEAITTVNFEGNSKSVQVFKTSDTDQIYEWCNTVKPNAVGCSWGNKIYIPTGPTCYTIAAHELSHIFGIAGLDRPAAGGYRL